MIKKYDDSGFRPRPTGNGGNAGTGNRSPLTNGFGPTKFAAFMPGQKGLLAQQLNQGFGGGMGQWKGLLANTYDPVTVPGFEYGGGAGKGAANGWTKQQQQTIARYANADNPDIINTSEFMALGERIKQHILDLRAKNAASNPAAFGGRK